MKILVLVPLWIEQIFLFGMPPGVEIKRLDRFLLFEKKYDYVILFGTCGLLTRTPNNVLYMPEKVYNYATDQEIELETIPIDAWKVRKAVTTDFVVKDFKTKDALLDIDNFDLVDMEDARVAEAFQGVGVKLAVVRYAIDYCNHKLKPKGINWLYRYYQHWRMQRKFVACLKSLKEK